MLILQYSLTKPEARALIEPCDRGWRVSDNSLGGEFVCHDEFPEFTDALRWVAGLEDEE